MTRLSSLIVLLMFTVGCATQSPAQTHQLEFRPASYEPSPGSVAFQDPNEPRTVYVSPSPIITHKDIRSAKQTTQPQTDAPAIQLELKEAAGDRMYEYTRNHIRKPIAIVLDGALLSAPTVMSTLRTQLMIIGGPEGLTPDQVQHILDAINPK